MLTVVLWLSLCHMMASIVAVPPDKGPPLHTVNRRSIDVNSALALASETRLTGGVQPHHYTLKFVPHPDTALEPNQFYGLVIINVTFHKYIDKVEFHCHQFLDIYEGKVYAGPKNDNKLVKQPVVRLERDEELQKATLILMGTIHPESEGYIQMEFGGFHATEKPEGYFRTTYNEQDVVRNVDATQFRPVYARNAFPCFDQPKFKATFDLVIAKRKTQVILGNTPIYKVRDMDNPEYDLNYFERTPPMSTHELGWVIADLQQVGSSTYYTYENGNATEIRVWGRPEFLPALEGVTERVTRVFKELADFWSVLLPIKQLNVVALPHYSGIKPIDAWGLIMFKESDLANNGYLQLAQEIGYQWVGGLTTPDWWTEIHMNKALVGYLAAETALKLSNGTEMEGKWPMTVLYSLYYEYSKRFPHSRITGMKQETMCTKIELILRMFNLITGQDMFRKGLRQFMNRTKYATFSRTDVWDRLNDVDLEEKHSRIRPNGSPRLLNAIASNWMNQDRLPLVTAHRYYENNTVQVTQKVYLRERPHDVPDAYLMKWYVPLVIAEENKLQGKRLSVSELRLDWMNLCPLEELKDMPSKEYFIIINPEEIGPFPVNYDLHNWYLLSKFLLGKDRELIPELTRAKLLHDAWNLAYAGELDFATALDMTRFLQNEKHHIVWDPVFTMIDHVGRQLPSGLHEKFEKYCKMLLTHLYEDLTANEMANEEPNLKNLKTMAKNFLCQAGYEQCVLDAQEQFSKWMQAKDPDEGNPIMNQHICPVFRYGSIEEWEFGLQRVINFPASRKQSERTYLLKTLAGCPRDNFKLNRLLNVTILERQADFSDTDLHLVFSMMAGNSYGSTTLLTFLHTHWELLKQRYRNNTRFWDNFINTATSSFTTKQGLEMVSKLHTTHKGEFKSAEHLIEKNMKNIKEEIYWSSESFPIMEKWLDDYFKSNGATWGFATRYIRPLSQVKSKVKSNR